MPKEKTQTFGLDAKDLKILAALEKDARQSYKEIAKKAGVSKEVVLYRVRNLEKSGIIRGYLAEIDLYKLGFRLYPVLFRLEELSAQEEAAISTYLKKSKSLAWAAWCEGAWNLNLVICAKNVREVAEFLDDFGAKFGSLVSEKALMHTVSLNYFRRSFGPAGESRQIIRTEEAAEEIELDKKEEKLVTLLSGNARKPMVEISRELGISAPAAMLRRLEKNGIIQGYRVFTGFRARGYSYHKIWLSLKGMSSRDWKALYKFLSFNPYVLWATRVVGHYDFSIELEVPDEDALADFISGLKEKFHEKIRKRDMTLVSEEMLVNYFPAKL